ncbi:M56 family metallopeptidase [Aeoliella mucimassa]|uniref:Regulatory protein BlaR1 n=1 Tax=Aeoliella mucimassa TaxID=2527972 RepID=A0A518APR0_9BACT|nr:M56 family metallopeptidase [Aeoliella mucimassa]QDU56702.1 Regulatory protein BlaR1 [Aeoliella mucimassa]
MRVPTLLDPNTSAWLVESLAHTLWQGTLVAGLAVLATAVLRNRSEQSRYWMHCGAMLLIAACLPLNLWLLEPSNRNETSGVGQGTQVGLARSNPPLVEAEYLRNTTTAEASHNPIVVGSPTEESMLPVAISSQPILDQTAPWERVSAWLVSLYIAGLAAMVLRLLFGLYGSHRIRATAQPIRDDILRELVGRLKERLRLRTVPLIAYSARVTTPLVVGVVKPAILLPAAIFSNLTTEQVESLLLHELAHIRRYDHLVNLLQRVVETLLFFHPAVWWLSHKISVEREHCCDDLAIRWGSEPCDYAESLVRVSELRLQSAGLGVASAATLAASGGRPSRLHSRVLRVLGMPLPGPSIGLSRLVLALLLTVGLAAVVVLAAAPPKDALSEISSELASLSHLDQRRINEWSEQVIAGGLTEEEFLQRLKQIGSQSVRGVIPLMSSAPEDVLAVKGIEQFLDHRTVVDYLAAILTELSNQPPHFKPNTRHCCLILLGKSGRREHVDLIAKFLADNPISAAPALGLVGGEEARDHLIRAFNRVPMEQWWILARALRQIGDPAAVPELKRRLAMLAPPPSGEFPQMTVKSYVDTFIDAIRTLSEESMPTPIVYSQGQHFRYPYDGPGTPKTFSVDPPRNHYVKLPEVDPNTETGKAAIWDAMKAETKGPGFTLDGEEVVLLNGLKAMPLWEDGPPYPTTMHDWLGETSHSKLLVLAKREAREGRVTVPENGLLLAVDPNDRLYVLHLEQKTPEFEYVIGVRPLDPLRQLVSSEKTLTPITEWLSMTLYDLESREMDGALNLNRRQSVTMTEQLWRGPGSDAVMVTEFVADKVALAIPGADRFVLCNVDRNATAFDVIHRLSIACSEDSLPIIQRHKKVHEDGGVFHVFDHLTQGLSFAFAAQLPNGVPVAGQLTIEEVDHENQAVKVRYRVLRRDITAQLLSPDAQIYPDVFIAGPADGFTQEQMLGWVEARWRREYPEMSFQLLDSGTPKEIKPHDWLTMRVRYAYSWNSTPSDRNMEHRYYTFTKKGEFVRSDMITLASEDTAADDAGIAWGEAVAGFRIGVKLVNTATEKHWSPGAYISYQLWLNNDSNTAQTVADYLPLLGWSPDLRDSEGQQVFLGPEVNTPVEARSTSLAAGESVKMGKLSFTLPNRLTSGLYTLRQAYRVECDGETVELVSGVLPLAVKELGSLAGIPEFSQLRIDMPETQLKEIIARHDLDVQTLVSNQGQATNYTLTTPRGESVIVMFRNGVCSGIQHLRDQSRDNELVDETSDDPDDRSEPEVAEPASAEQFQWIERFARLPADEQAEGLPAFYAELTPGVLNPMIEGILSSYPHDILNPHQDGDAYDGDTRQWAQQLEKASNEMSVKAVADKLELPVWIRVATRARALRLLERHPEVTDKLIESDLQKGGKDEVERAAAIIVSLQLQGFSGRLIELWLEGEEAAQPAWNALVFLRDPEIIDRLLERMEQDPSFITRCSGLFQGPLADKAAEPKLLDLLSSTDSEIRFHAADALQHCRDARLAKPAERMATEDDERLRLIAAQLVSSLPDAAFAEVRDQLLTLLHDDSDEVRFKALHGFAGRKDRAAGQAILEALQREELNEQYKAWVMQAMSSLTGESWSYNLHRWGPGTPENREAIARLEAWIAAH